MIMAALKADDHVYVYGVARANAAFASPLGVRKGVVPGCPVELVRFRSLSVIVSAFPADAAAPNGAADEDEWARHRAVAHHHVVADLSRRFPLVPSKFGIVLRSLDSLAAFIEQNAAVLEEILDLVTGCSEWGLKLAADPSIAFMAAQSAPSLAPLQEELALVSEGKAFFVRKKLKQAAEEEARRMLTARATEVHQALDAVARRSIHVRTYPSHLTAGAKGGQVMLLNAAYLVETAAAEVFHRTLDAKRGSFEALGLSGRSTGPWPPYNFVSLPSGEDAHV